MLGGGYFDSQNKVLPGFYANFISANRASTNISERGYASVPLCFDFGPCNEIITLKVADFEKNSKKLFGYEYDDDKLKLVREIFKHSHTLYTYRLNGGGAKATNTYATCKYAGVRGNDIRIVINVNVDDNNKFDVLTYLDNDKVDSQTVTDATGLVSNDYVDFKNDAELAVTTGINLTGGTNSTVSASDHQNYLDLIEAYSFNCMGCPSSDSSLIALYIAFQKRMREERGVKFQTVVYRNAADYEGVINLKNTVTDTGADAYSLVYWLTGAETGCKVNASLLNHIYDGEFTIDTAYTQAQLEEALQSGEFVFHKVGEEIRVLDDISSLTTLTTTKGEALKENQTIRVMDIIGNDYALIFNQTFLGKVPNDEEGRITLKDKFMDELKALNQVRAIEPYDDGAMTVSRGEHVKSVVVDMTEPINIINVMAKCYMTIRIA